MSNLMELVSEYGNAAIEYSRFTERPQGIHKLPEAIKRLSEARTKIQAIADSLEQQDKLLETLKSSTKLMRSRKQSWTIFPQDEALLQDSIDCNEKLISECEKEKTS